jgi:4-aminobutyrate aminotransferase-like enzyme
MGKPMGSGLPVSGVVATEEITNSFHKKAFYFNTTAATPLQAAVGGTVIDIIQDEGLIENASRIGSYLKNELEKIKDNFDFLGDIRGPGLFIGLDIVDNKEDKNPDKDKAVELVEMLKTKGILISNAGQHRNVLKLRPPLVFDSSHADLLLEGLGASFKEVS